MGHRSRKKKTQPVKRRTIRTEVVVLLAILAVAAALRVAYLAEIRDDPGLNHPPVDSAFTLYWARGLATDNWELPPDAAGRDPRLRDTAFHRPPGYPWALSVIYRLTDGSPLAIRAIQMLGGLLSVILAWWLGRRLMSPAVGLVWASFMAVHWGFIYFEAGFNGMWLVIPLLLGAMIVLHDLVCAPTTRNAMMLGFVIGLVVLVRSNALLLGPILGLWIVVVLGRRHGVKTALATLGAVALAGALTISPATVRNYLVSGHFVPVSANAGMTLYHGNNDAAKGYSAAAVGETGRMSSPWDAADLMARTAQQLGHPVGFVETSRRLGRQARTWMADNPGAALGLVGTRALLFWGPDEMAHSTPVAADRASSPLLRRLPFAFALALAGCLWGWTVFVVRSRSEDGNGRLDTGVRAVLIAMILVTAGWYASFLPFFVTSLYRLPVVPFLLLGAAVGTVATVELVRSARWKTAAIGLGGLALLVGLLSVPVIPVDPGVAERHVMLGTQWRFAGDIDRSEAEFRRALQLAPESAAAQGGLAALLLDTGRVNQALPLFESALEKDPGNPQLHFNLGLTWARKGDWSAAAGSFERAAQLSPNLVAAHVLLGSSLEHTGDFGGASKAYDEALVLDPANVQAANSLAWLLATAPDAEDRDGARAVELARGVVAIRSNAATLDTLAAALAEAGRFEEAVAVAEAAVQANNVAAMIARPVLDARLELFRSGLPYHQRSGQNSGTGS
jgi:tetratricopeptide (TPR) repeat protein